MNGKSTSVSDVEHACEVETAGDEEVVDGEDHTGTRDALRTSRARPCREQKLRSKVRTDGACPWLRSRLDVLEASGSAKADAFMADAEMRREDAPAAVSWAEMKLSPEAAERELAGTRGRFKVGDEQENSGNRQGRRSWRTM
jgi:hypothetical protein